jgi:energy-coupling factor transport system ATP-binding protein
LTVPEFVNAVKEREKTLLSGNGHSMFSPDWVTHGANHLDSAATDPVISVSRLEHTYLRGTPLESVALRDVNIQAGRGQVIGIIGHTGSGKSTLIQHLNGLLRPQSGEVRVLDYDLRQPRIDLRALRRSVGLVFQFPEAQLFEQHVGDDVAFGPWQMGLRGEELKTRVHEAMDAVGLAFDSFKDRPLYGLSGGERRRAALAGVLAIRPEILVLDEPTAGLDPRGHQDILDRIMTLHREWGTTLVIISHNMEEIARLCDRIFVLANGKTVLSGTPREVFAERSRVESYGLGVPQVTAALQELSGSGIAVRGDALTVDEAEQVLANGRI